MFVDGEPYAVYISPMPYILSQSFNEKNINSLGIHNSLIGIKYKFIFDSFFGIFLQFSIRTPKIYLIERILVICIYNLHE